MTRGAVLVLGGDPDAGWRAARLEGGRLEDHLRDPPPMERAPRPGALYAAKIDRVVPKLGSAFVQLGGGASGFLREAKGVQEGARLIVQAVSEAEDGKATPVTRRVLIKGRRVILSPDAPGVNVSRQIRDAETRRRLTEIGAAALAGAAAAETALPETAEPETDWRETVGLIFRSAAEGAPETELLAEIDAMLAGWRAVLAREAGLGHIDAPAVPGADAVAVALREWTSPAPRQIILGAAARARLLGMDPQEPDLTERRRAASPEAVIAAQADLIARIAPPEEGDPFEVHGVLEALDRLAGPRADLPSAAWISVEPTRACVAIDVNTGGDFGGAAGLTANLEAAREIPRQLRLRGLGGQIVVDFAPMAKKERRRVEDALKTAFRRDPVETSLAGWTPLGLFEMQRKRERRPLDLGTTGG